MTTTLTVRYPDAAAAERVVERLSDVATTENLTVCSRSNALEIGIANPALSGLMSLLSKGITLLHGLFPSGPAITGDTTVGNNS